MSTNDPAAKDPRPAASTHDAAVPELDPEAPSGPLLSLVHNRKIAFLAIGATNTAIGFGLFVLFHGIFGDHLYLLNLLCTHVISVVIAFVLYRYLVFRVRGNLLRDAWRFETVYLTGLALNAVLLYIGVSLIHLHPILVQAFVVVITATWSWIGHGRFSFKRQDDQDQSATSFDDRAPSS